MANPFAGPSFLRTFGLVFLAIAVLSVADAFLAKMERVETRVEAARLFEQGRILMQRGQSAEAIKRIEDAITIERGNRDYLRTLAQAQFAAGRTDDAESTLAELLQSDSTDGPASLIMGRVLSLIHISHWQWLGAVVFGVLIAATDPVSVIATFKEAKAQGRLLVLIEAESLFNDGTAAVAFGVVVAMASGQQLTSFEISAMLLKTIGGGVLCGAAVALGALVLAGRTDDHLVEITFTTVAAYGSFLLAEHFGWSGVLATITAGLVMGNFKAFGTISDGGKEAVQAFWEYAAFVANSLVFLLIGMHEAHQNLSLIHI